MNVVFFDVETQRSFDEVGGRHNIRRMGLAAAVTYSTATGAYHHYTEDRCAELLAELRAADLVVGFNVLSFDYEVLRAYTDDPLDDLPTVDMLDHVYRRLGFRVGLNALAECTLGCCKSADGLQALAWYREGKMQEILDYCQQDVEVTRQLYEYGRQYKHLKYRDKMRRLQMVPVSW
ncbi:MAG: ribonuclease H-like domain-containing protein [Anaerolineae bacterium]|jgi:DEAD/DEAH box helicase domain-containing protein|nr:ribonuclease H-like domain-containing protein [Anaerolineae bacterium]MDX9829434.1 ribonuclease H-like domain-containing protein [Anaerolineae bacterium]